MNFSLFPVGFLGNSRIFFLKPNTYSFIIALVSSTNWFLRRKSPNPQITTDRNKRHFNVKTLQNQKLYRLASPQRKRKL